MNGNGPIVVAGRWRSGGRLALLLALLALLGLTALATVGVLLLG